MAKRKEYELIEKTYCDVCGRNTRKASNTTYGINGYDICGGYFAGGKYPKDKHDLKCQDKLKLDLGIASGDRCLN